MTRDPKFVYTIEHADESYRSRCPKEEAKVRFFGHCCCHRRASFQKGHPIVPGSPEHRATGQTEYYAVFRIQLESGEIRTYIGKRALFSWWFFLFVYYWYSLFLTFIAMLLFISYVFLALYTQTVGLLLATYAFIKPETLLYCFVELILKLGWFVVLFYCFPYIYLYFKEDQR